VAGRCRSPSRVVLGVLEAQGDATFGLPRRPTAQVSVLLLGTVLLRLARPPIVCREEQEEMESHLHLRPERWREAPQNVIDLIPQSHLAMLVQEKHQEKRLVPRAADAQTGPHTPATPSLPVTPVPSTTVGAGGKERCPTSPFWGGEPVPYLSERTGSQKSSPCLDSFSTAFFSSSTASGGASPVPPPPPPPSSGCRGSRRPPLAPAERAGRGRRRGSLLG